MNHFLLIRLWSHIGTKRRRQFFWLLSLMLIASFFEVMSIGAVVPFLAALTNPEQLFDQAWMKPAISFIGINQPSELLLPLAILFGTIAVLAGAIRLVLLWANTKLSFSTGADLSLDIYRKTLYQPYSTHVIRNSSEVISGITKKTDSVISKSIDPVFKFISASIMMIAILATLLSINPKMTIYAFIGFGFVYGIVLVVTRNRMAQDSERVAAETTLVFKALQEGLGGIRDVLIDGSQSIYCDIYRKADIPMRNAQARSIFISSSPRFAVEALGMLLVAILAYLLTKQDGGLQDAIPVLGVIVLGAQRLLPVLQQAYAAISNLRAGRSQLIDTLDLLDQPLPDYAHQLETIPIPFKQTLTLCDVGFRYSELSPWVLKNLNLEITKGSCVGFVGSTGSGKSTLLDILMGLLTTTEGLMKIDNTAVDKNNNRSWQLHLAHVPQKIYLSDSSIKENIAFGVLPSEIDFSRVERAASQAQLDDFIEQLPKKYDTQVGEGGVRLSGGQRQRIAIARALYKEADVIIFDEATSALDGVTENAVMESLSRLGTGLTVLMVAHRVSTLQNCDKIIEIGNGGIIRVGKYQDFTLPS